MNNAVQLTIWIICLRIKEILCQKNYFYFNSKDLRTVEWYPGASVKHIIRKIKSKILRKNNKLVCQEGNVCVITYTVPYI